MNTGKGKQYDMKIQKITMLIYEYRKRSAQKYDMKLQKMLMNTGKGKQYDMKIQEKVKNMI